MKSTGIFCRTAGISLSLIKYKQGSIPGAFVVISDDVSHGDRYNPQETVDVANGSQFTLNKGTAVLPEKIGSNDISALKAELRDVSGLTVTDGKITPTLPKNNTLTDKPDTVKALGQEMVDLSVATVTPSLMVFKVYTYSYLPAALNGSTKELYVNYYIPENKVLKLSDLIKSGSEQAMLTAVQSSLTSHYSNLPPE